MEKRNDALTAAQQDVASDPSPATEDTQTADSADTQSPAPDAGNMSGQGDDDDKAGGRDLKNVRAEVLRKQEKLAADINARFGRLEGMLEGALARPDKQGQPATPKEKPVSQYSTQELRALEGKIPDENKAEYDKLLRAAEIREQAEEVVNNRFEQQTFLQKKEAANRDAYHTWPQLSDAQGAFYREVNKELNAMGDSVVKSPTAVRDAANAVGLRMGLTPTAQRLMTANTHGDIGGRSGPAPKGANSLNMADGEFDKISPSLQRALRSGKFTKEQKERIKENTGRYRKNKDLYIK